MSLFGSMQIAKNALSAAQLGLQVTGNNIANAHTPDYLRQEIELRAAPTQRVGNLLLGTGVEVRAVFQRVDLYLEERLRSSTSDLANNEAQEKTFVQLETLLGELSDTDLSSSLNRFFGAIHDVVNQPDSSAVRNVAVLAGENLAADIRRLDRRVREERADVNERIGVAADEINRLTEEIARLNIQIVQHEGGGASPSDAVGLRDRRQRALTLLSEVIDVRAVEQTSGAVNVFSGGEFLVFDGQARRVASVQTPNRGLMTFELRLEATDAPLRSTGGEVGGLIAARDEILGGFIDQLDEFTRTLAFEFNRVFASGQGLSGYTELTSEHAVKDPTAPLDQAGLPFAPDNGAFQVLVRDNRTGLTQTTEIRVGLNGLEDDVTLDDLVNQLDAIDGLSAEINRDGKLALSSDSAHLDFAFGDDTSGVLAALGMNTFFTGTSAGDLNVKQTVHDDPSKFAASQGGIGHDANIAEQLAVLLSKPLAAREGGTLTGHYEGIVANVAQNASAVRASAEGFRVFKNTLEGQKLAVSGVNLDEEAVRMMAFQRTFQASARFISTVNELLGLLVNL
jgi:flagellar hook-associated protein 1 FlgK